MGRATVIPFGAWWDESGRTSDFTWFSVRTSDFTELPRELEKGAITEGWDSNFKAFVDEGGANWIDDGIAGIGYLKKYILKNI